MNKADVYKKSFNKMDTSGFRFYRSALSNYFYVKDYLGNTRAMIDTVDNSVQVTDYYPGGLPTAPFGPAMSAEERLHTGKEFNAFSGLA